MPSKPIPEPSPSRPIYDKQGRIPITVDQTDIDTAVRNDSSSCAVATAIKRNLPKALRVTVDIQTIRMSFPETNRRLVFLTPSSVQRYIVAFDAGDAIVPFDFRLQHPAWSTRIRTASIERPTEPDPNEPENLAIITHGSHDARDSTFAGNRNEERMSVIPVSRPPRTRTHDNYFRRSYGIRAMRINQTK